MRAIQITEFGGPEVLELRDIDAPEPGGGAVVLGIQRTGGAYVGVPHGDAVARPGDVLVVYGRAEHIDELDDRRRDAAGERAHAEALSQRQEEERREAAATTAP